MGHVAVGDGRLMPEGAALRWKSHLASLVTQWKSFREPGPTNPSGRQVSNPIYKNRTYKSEACSADDDKQGSKRLEACSAGLTETQVYKPAASQQLAGANDGGFAILDAPSAGSEFVQGFQLVLTHMAQAAPVANREARQNAMLFHSVHPPSMGIQDYLERIRKYFRCSDECFVVALVYIDRVAKAESGVSMSALNAHRLLLVAVVIAAKFQDDIHYSNAYYARVGGLPLSEVNSLETQFVEIISWKLCVGPEEYQFYHNAVCQATSDCVPSHVLVQKPYASKATNAQVQMRSLSRPYLESEATVCRHCGQADSACVCKFLPILL